MYFSRKGRFLTCTFEMLFTAQNVSSEYHRRGTFFHQENLSEGSFAQCPSNRVAVGFGLEDSIDVFETFLALHFHFDTFQII